MITGLGTDMIEVARVAAKINKENGFRELVFSKKEIAYCESKTNKFEHYAARFAAKEAFLKAIGTGWINGISFNEIEIDNDEKGKPVLALLGQTAASLSEMGSANISVSVTHIKEIASATVIIEK